MRFSARVLLAKTREERHMLLRVRRAKGVRLALLFICLAGIAQSVMMRYFGVGELAGIYQLRLTAYAFFLCASFVLAQAMLVDENSQKLLSLRGLATNDRLERIIPNFLGTLTWILSAVTLVNLIPYCLLFSESALAHSYNELIQFLFNLALLTIGFAVSVAATRSLTQLIAPNRSVLLNAIVWLAPLSLEALALQETKVDFFMTAPRSLPGVFLRYLYQLNADYLGLC